MKNNFLIILFLTFVPIKLFGQDDIGKLINKSSNIYSKNPAESFALCELAERKADEQGDPQFDGDISLCKGRYYLLVTKYDLANLELNKAIIFFKKKNDLVNLSSAYSLKSILLDRIGDNTASHLMLLKVLQIDRELKDVSGIIGSLQNLSLDYMEIGDVDSMKICLQELDSLEIEFDNQEYYYYYQNWGYYYLVTQQFEKSVEFFEKAREVAENEKMIDSQATILMLLSTVYRNKGDLKIAEELGVKSYEYSKINNLIYEMSEALSELILVKEAQGDFKGAYKWQKEQVKIEKEIYDLEKFQKLKAIEGQLQIAEKEKLIVQGELDLQAEKLVGAKARERNMLMYFVVVGVLLLLIFILLIYLRTRRLNTTIKEQKEVVELKSMFLEEAMRNIKDSLEYSKLIQNSMLPEKKLFDNFFKSSFILYKPKDIVSGDFYWMHRYDNTCIVAVGDCTGHGVPGAMVSMVCQEALSKVVKEYGILEPNKILDAVRDIVVQTFNRNTHNVNDGMDIAICTIEGNKLLYAGAYNPLWIIREDVLIEIKADKQPIGNYNNPTPFVLNSFEIQPNDMLYIFSDGYADQFGGDKGKKLKKVNFQKLLMRIRNLDMTNQKVHLTESFEKWRGTLEQLDDVCVIGLKI